MLFRNAVKASKISNCIEFSDTSSGIIPIFHRKKHAVLLVEQNAPTANNGFTPSEQKLAQQLEEKEHSEFVENVLYYISGHIVAKLVKSITCTACKNCLHHVPSQVLDSYWTTITKVQDLIIKEHLPTLSLSTKEV